MRGYYITSKLERIVIKQDGMHDKDTLLTEPNIKELRRLIGKLRWVTDQSRPDGAFDELWLSIKAGCPTVNEYNKANNLVDEMKGREVKIMYRPLLDKAKWFISVFTDASQKGLPDKISSSYGIVIFMSNGYVIREKNLCSVLHWKSGKVKRVVSGIYDAEILAMSEGLEYAIVIRKQLLAMTGFPKDMIEIEAFCDNLGAVNAIENVKEGFFRGKTIGLEIGKIRQMLSTKEVLKIEHVAGVYQIADGLTKVNASKEPVLQAIQNGRFMN